MVTNAKINLKPPSFVKKYYGVWPYKGLAVASPDYQVGTHFEALGKGVCVVPLKSIQTFLAMSTFPEVRCPTETKFVYHKCWGGQGLGWAI